MIMYGNHRRYKMKAFASLPTSGSTSRGAAISPAASAEFATQYALHHAFTDNRQRAGGRTDDNIGILQAGVDIAEADNLSASLIRRTCAREFGWR